MKQVVGIDVSKARLDACDLTDARRLGVGNDAAGITEPGLWLEPDDLEVMEASRGFVARRVHAEIPRQGGVTVRLSAAARCQRRCWR